MSATKPSLNHRLPEVLWHGSAYQEDQRLRPGYLWMHKQHEWPSGESNHYIYASTHREHAIAYGLRACLALRWHIRNIKLYGQDTVMLESLAQITHHDLEEQRVWLYELWPTTEEQWLYNHQHDSSDETEYKTHRVIDFVHRTEVNLKDWLGKKDIVLRRI